MKFHPLADLFPLMQGAEFDELVADIKVNGLREPIWLYEKQILDGRNRWRACIELGRRGEMKATPPCKYYKGKDPLSFVVSLNLHRRHLTSGQRAMLALKLEEIEAPRAKERQREHGNTAPGRKSVSADLRQVKGKASDKAAKAMKVSARQVQKAKKLKKRRPDLAKKVARPSFSPLRRHAPAKLLR